MSTQSQFEMQAEFYKALAHPLRVQVLEILMEKELCFSDILELTGGLKSNLSQHLTLMCKSGILSMRRAGQCNYYKIRSAKILKADKLFREVMREQIAVQQSFFA